MGTKRCRAAAGRWGGILGLMVLLPLAGCGDSPSEPSVAIEEVVGTYDLIQLTFDPQGVLPQTDILTALGTTPRLVITSAKTAQVVYEDPATSLVTTIGATVRTTNDGVRIDFDGGSGYAGLLLSRRMQFSFTAGSGVLSFNDEAPDGASRQRLVQLVPAWSGEQLLNPVPGELRVTFQRR